MKDEKLAFLGDTIHAQGHPTEPLTSFSPLQSMVFSGCYPQDTADFVQLEEAITRVR